MKMSFFKAPVRNTKPLTTITPSQLFSYIISDKAREYTEAIRQAPKEEGSKIKRSKLDFVTPCACFTQRKLNGLVSVSGLLVLDIDHVSNPSELLTEAVSIIRPLVAFISPSGDGVKFITDVRQDYANLGWLSFDTCIQTDEERQKAADTYKEIYNRVSDLWNRTWTNAPVDMSGSDITRACFLPHNTLAYISPSLYLDLLRNGSK